MSYPWIMRSAKAGSNPKSTSNPSVNATTLMNNANGSTVKTLPNAKTVENPSNITNRGNKKTVLNNAQRSSNEKQSLTKQQVLSGSNSSLIDAVSNFTSSQRKRNKPALGGLRLKQEPAEQKTQRDIHALKSISALRKVGAKVGAVMRRASSKDSLESNREREKENCAKPISRLVKTTNTSGLTIAQLEKEKNTMEQQISELVRNAESKKAEIATLKMEIKRLKKPNEEENNHLLQELENLQSENRSLKERLLDLGVPLEQTSLSDSEKEQLLLRRSASGSMASLDSSEKKDPCQCRKTEGNSPEQDSEVGEASGTSLPPAGRPLSEWDKASSSSQSEMSVACLQDRIMQMEETHYSTNEELQATLQELTDLQDQLTDLQMENDRMGEDKAVLLESLCSQTEKLEACRSQIAQLKQLLFRQFEESGERLSASDRERHYVELLKNAQEEQEALLVKQSELSETVEAIKDDSLASQVEYHSLQDKVRQLESTVEGMSVQKRLLESDMSVTQEHISSHQIEVNQLRLQLENEQQKVSELEKERDANATSELESLLKETRKDKERVEEHCLRLQEQLSLCQREVAKLKEQLSLLQEETKNSKSQARKQVSDLEHRVDQMSMEKVAVLRETEMLGEALQEAELKCQRHLEDKRELKATVGELQKALMEEGGVVKDLFKELEEAKDRFATEREEWDRFQIDLLTTVRVANDFKTEAQIDVERLKEKVEALEKENEKIKSQNKQEMICSPTHSSRGSPLRSSGGSFTNATEATVLSTVERDLGSARRPLGPGKLADYRGASQLSVRGLIESIENATKQVKGQGLSSSRSSSTSSISSLASEASRNTSGSLILAGTGDLFLKRPSSADSGSCLRDNKPTLVQPCRLQRGSVSEATAMYVKSANGGTQLETKSENETTKPHPVSILASKLEPIRRNSYGYLDVVEKKDPLSSLVKGGGSKRNALLKWCQNKTVGYKSIDITNFSSSWNDGLAFCALIHSYLPDVMPYDELDNKDKKRNFTLAFQAGESVGIPNTLNINDLISQERPDWQSIMTYVTAIYKHFET